jgi:hypothetical protein
VIDLKLSDFLNLALVTPVLLVAGYFVRPHWKKLDLAAKFVLGLIPGLFALSWVVLLLTAVTQQIG